MKSLGERKDFKASAMLAKKIWFNKATKGETRFYNKTKTGIVGSQKTVAVTRTADLVTQHIWETL